MILLVLGLYGCASTSEGPPGEAAAGVVSPADSAGAATAPAPMATPSEPSAVVPAQSVPVTQATAEWMIARREGWSKNVGAIGRRMDRFFAGDDYEEQINSSFLRVTLGEVFQPAATYVTKNKLKAHVDLPGTKKRWKLVFETDDEEQDSLQTEANPPPPADILITDRDNAASGALRYAFAEYHRWRFDADAGIKTPLPLDPFVRFRARRQHQIDDNWLARFTETLYYYDDAFLVSRTELAFERPITDTYFFRNVSKAKYTGVDDIWELAEAIATYHIISEKWLVDYELGVIGRNKPSRTDNYYLTSRLRRMLYQDWFYVDFQPTLAFPRDKNFSLTPSFEIRFEILLQE